MIKVLHELLRVNEQGQAAVLITVIDKKDPGPATIGKKMLVSSDGKIVGTIGGGELEQGAMVKAQDLLIARANHLEHISLSPSGPSSHTATNMLCGGLVTLFFEYIPVKPLIYICGAGHIGRALAYYLQKLDYFVILIEKRVEMVIEFPPTTKVLSGEYEQIFAREQMYPHSYIVIASYSHEEDYTILKAIHTAGWQPHYIGLVASSNKAALITEKLKQEVSSDIDFTNLYSPAGLNIGGKSAEEVALSIIAEIQALRYARNNTTHLS